GSVEVPVTASEAAAVSAGLSPTVSDAECAPTVVGLDLTPTVQLALAASVDPQVVDERVKLTPSERAMVSVPVAVWPPLCTVNSFSAPALPIGWSAKVHEVGDIVSAAGASAVPESAEVL